MKTKQIRDFTPAEIEKHLEESYQELFNLRFQLTTGKAKNYKRKGVVRRTIAQMKTIQRERELGFA